MNNHKELNRPGALAGQFLPAFLCLWPLLARNDTQLALGVAFALAVIVASAVSLFLRWRRPPARRGRFLRAWLAIALSAMVLFYAVSERRIVALRINALAAFVQQQCQRFGECPARIAGWNASEGERGSWWREESRVAHHFVYASNGKEFELRIDLGAGLGERCRGGVTQPLQVLGTWPAF